jgi:hypothetical protein
MTAPRRLSEFLKQAADQAGNPGLFEGAIIFVALERTLDRLIQNALAAGDYHRGTPSPWSHVFLLAEPYHGPETGLVECTVRSEENKIIWDQDHADPIAILWHKDVHSGICRGKVGDYDDNRVTRWGIKWLPELLPAQRRALVEDAEDPKWKPYHYDFPGLLRELIRLISGGAIVPPAGEHLLFCSAFVQEVYMDVLGLHGHFVAGVRDDDTSPDDLWYPTVGTKIGPAPG